MEYNNLLELIKTVSALNISGFQYEEAGTKIIITTGGNGLPGAVGVAGGAICGASAGSTMMNSEGVVVALESQGKVAEQNGAGVENHGNSVAQSMGATENPATVKPLGNIVKSPLVGTFYAAAAEDAEPFVKVGDVVKKGQTLAIVEAMKLMNDIEAEYDGTVLEIFVENGATVEYGQPLFSIG